MNRNVLLVEPNYKNKYPPIGLMKLATYHRLLGDNVVFFKGELRQLILNVLCEELFNKLNKIEPSINWLRIKRLIIEFLKTGSTNILEEILEINSGNKPLIIHWLKHYVKLYRNNQYKNYLKWDRICITTMFTFNWNLTIRTIEFAKDIVKSKKQLWVGGIMASLLAEEVEKVTGIRPFIGLLDKPGILDENEYIIDELPLDYSILEEIDYKYPANNAYFFNTTKGCIRKCRFCAVPKLEPSFKEYLPLQDNIELIKDKYGEKQNLLLLDNNVLASKYFDKIIEDIKNTGFKQGAKYIEPNQFELAIRNIKNNFNVPAYVRKTYQLLQEFLDRRVKGKTAQNFYDLLNKYDLLYFDTFTKEGLIEAYPYISPIYERYRTKVEKLRYVDFNQGLDVRLLTKEKIKKLSEIAINPLRIAFDSMKLKDAYINSIQIAAKHGIRYFSNYLLYNYTDKPEDLYERLKMNVILCEELDVDIYSFPMKYLPIFGNYRKNRDFIGKYWNKKYIRAIQAILNSTKGKVGRGMSFFEKAFGKNIEEYFKLLHMPETYIVFRLIFEKNGYTAKWEDEFYNQLSNEEREIVKKVIYTNSFKNIIENTSNKKIQKVLQHYLISREIINKNIKLSKGDNGDLTNESFIDDIAVNV